ncbi:MAG TPA: hypothetical protein VFG04_01235 [Planctomycetaceae bacterium]|jgi:hypothetical protein|nr:hypothetical protein [Planctomycetaceae bacterium]
MKRLFVAMLVPAVAVLLLGASARADGGKSGEAIVDKAIRALGGEAKLKEIKTYTSTSKGKLHLGGTENPFTSTETDDGLNRYRQVLDLELNGEKMKIVTVIDGEKGWGKAGEQGQELDKDKLANAKRANHMVAVSSNPLLLKEKGFKYEAAPDEKYEGKEAACLKVTGPDGKDFKILFDKQTGLPAAVIGTIANFTGEEVTQDLSYKEYKDFDGFKTPTKIAIKHNGAVVIDADVTEFKRVEKVDPKTFANPLD